MLCIYIYIYIYVHIFQGSWNPAGSGSGPGSRPRGCEFLEIGRLATGERRIGSERMRRGIREQASREHSSANRDMKVEERRDLRDITEGVICCHKFGSGK